jgi:hypothetical protein
MSALTPEQRSEADSFNALYAEWLHNRARYQEPDLKWSQTEEDAHSEREIELARLITTTPAVLPWMVFMKLEVLEYYLTQTEGGTAWTDNREYVMLAGIKADLRVFPPAVPKA